MADARVAELLFSGQAEAMGTQQKLLVAAVQAFSSSGFDGTSIRDIERACGATRGLIAYHFGSKEDLWRACVELLMAKFREAMTKHHGILRQISEPERAKVMLRLYVGFASKHPEFFRLLVVSGADEPQRVEWVVKGLAENVDFFRDVTGTRGSTSAEAEAMACYLFLGAASMIFAVPNQCKALFGVDPRDPEFVERFTDIVATFGFYDPLPLGGRVS